MSIASEITRLQTAKADLKTAIEGKGVTVSSSAKLDDYADLVDAIQTGGGGSVDFACGTYTPASNVSTFSVSVSFEPDFGVAMADPRLVTPAENNTTWKYFAVTHDLKTDYTTSLQTRYYTDKYNVTSGYSTSILGTYSDGQFTFKRTGSYQFISGVTYHWACWKEPTS